MFLFFFLFGGGGGGPHVSGLRPNGRWVRATRALPESGTNQGRSGRDPGADRGRPRHGAGAAEATTRPPAASDAGESGRANGVGARAGAERRARGGERGLGRGGGG